MTDAFDKNPDRLLSLIKRDDERESQGKLKIFLGAAAGVGKTYAMLQAAQLEKTRGIDVVVGLVEHHGRPLTRSLLNGLEVLPRKRIDYKGVELSEFDLDLALTRKAKIVLVDELAHTNAPGSRHAKRYLDVLELLKCGIDVYTTLNVQHIESRVDIVQDITKVAVHETIPDIILDRADEVLLIDIPPDDLLQRLNNGQIYPDDHARLAAQHFFKRGNLTALREMALRIAAERVDRELREYKTLHGIEGVWKSGGRLMVAIFASPYSEALIRWTRRVADLLGVTWIGAYVEGDGTPTADEQKLLAKNIALVRQIGGEVVATRDDDPVKGIMRMAQQNNVTQIIVGKSQRNVLQNFLRGGSLVNRLLRVSGNIDIYAVATNRARARQFLKHKVSVPAAAFKAEDFGWMVAIALTTWLIAAGLEALIGYMAVGIIFLLAVSVAGLFLTRAAVFTLAFTFAFIHNYYFIPPKFTLTVTNPEDLMLLSMFFVAAAVIGHLTTKLSQKERVLRSREERTTLLYNLARDIAAAQSVTDIVKSAEAQLETALGAEVTLLTATDIHLNKTIKLDAADKELAVAKWVVANGKIAGRGTDTLAADPCTYIPIIGRACVDGVARISYHSSSATLSVDQLTLIDAFLHQIASGIERENYHEKVKSLLVVEETQKLYRSLLDCVSHELKTPLAAIKGSASAIADPLTKLTPDGIESLARQILDGSDRLQRLVENLLDMTRIESGMMQAKRVVCDAEDIIATAIQSIDDLPDGQLINIHVAQGTPLLLCDPVLAKQALANVIHNAIRYAGPQSAIDIEARLGANHDIEVTVRDFGPGLPEDNPSKVLNKFFRADHSRAGGVGLGLSIAKGFMEAQQGFLEAANHKQGGAQFTLHFPRGSTT